MVLIGGVGRSGTHLLANILKSHPDLTVDIEREPQFTWAVNSVVWGRDITKLINLYKTKPVNYVTKDHPMMWQFHLLNAHIPTLKMIIMQRGAHQVVASSLQHAGVRQWVVNSALYPPNPLTGSLHPRFKDNLSVAEKLTLRWHLHANEVRALAKFNNVLVVDYNALLTRPDTILAALSNFLDIPNNFTFPTLNQASLFKWVHQLNPQQLQEINDIL